MKSLVLAFYLTFLAKYSEGVIKCELKSGISQAYINVGDKAIQGLKFHSGRSRGSMNMFQCFCDDNDLYNITDLWFSSPQKDIFDDADLQMVINGFDSLRWYEAEIFRIFGCDKLRLKLIVGRDTFAKDMAQKILIIERIKELELTDFTVGRRTTEGTFSSIFFRDVQFTSTPTLFEFEDKYEVAFERVNLSYRAKLPFEIKVDNKNVSVNGLVRVEESTFPGVESVLSPDLNNDKFIFDLENRQFAQDASQRDLCNYNYQGEIVFKRNTFGLLRFNSIKIRGGHGFHFMDNSIDVITDIAVDLTNVRNIHITGNQLGFPLKTPIFFFYYAEKSSGCLPTELDLPENQVGDTIIMHNRIDKMGTNFFSIDPDPNYSLGFIDKFKFSNNEVSKRCNCTSPTWPTTLKDSDKLNMKYVETLSCLSDQTPPLYGQRSTICSGVTPKTSEQLKLDSFQETKDRWVIYLVIAVFVTLILTAIAVIIIMKFCCSCSGGKDAVSPRP